MGWGCHHCRPHPAVPGWSPGLRVLLQLPRAPLALPRGAQPRLFPAGTAARRAGGCSTSSPPTTSAPRCSGPSSWLSCGVPAGARSSLSTVGAAPTLGTFRGARKGRCHGSAPSCRALSWCLRGAAEPVCPVRPGLPPPRRSPFPPGISKACEQNLRKTLQFGGRSLFPSSMELKAMVVRPGAHRQGFRSPPPKFGMTLMFSGAPHGHCHGAELMAPWGTVLCGDVP